MPNHVLLHLSHLPYFTLESYKQIAGIPNNRSQTARVQLARWHKAGKILRIKRGIYMTSSFYEAHHQDPDFLGAVSSILNPQSYLSSTYILQKRGILTEVTYPITAITPKNTQTIRSDLGTFTFQHITETLYTGFSQNNYLGITFYQASTAKALFDYLYLRPLSELARRKNIDLSAELRLNLDEMTSAEHEEFRFLINENKIPKMLDILRNFEVHVWQP